MLMMVKRVNEYFWRLMCGGSITRPSKPPRLEGELFQHQNNVRIRKSSINLPKPPSNDGGVLFKADQVKETGGVFHTYSARAIYVC